VDGRNARNSQGGIVRMKMYHVETANIYLSNHHDYILAKNFDEAYRKAVVLVASYKKEVAKEAELVTVEFENEITEGLWDKMAEQKKEA
jgi:hypothetical protein